MSDLPPLPDGFQIETPQTNNGAQDQSQNQAIPALPEGFQLETVNNPAAAPEQSRSWGDTANTVMNLVNDAVNPGARLGTMIGNQLYKAAPGIADSATAAFTAPYRALTGQLRTTDDAGHISPEAIAEGFNMAGWVTPSVPEGLLTKEAPEQMAKRVIIDVASKYGRPGNQVGLAADRIGVELPRATTTDSKIVQSVGKGLENQPLIGSPLLNANEKALSQVDNATKAIQDEFGTGSIPNAGAQVRAAFTNYSKKILADKEAANYDKVDSLIQHNVMNPLDKTGEVMLDIMARRRNATLPDGPAVRLVKKAVFRQDSPPPGADLSLPVKPGDTVESVFNLGRGLNYRGIKDLRSYVRETLDNPNAITQSGFSEQDLKRVYSALSDDLRTAVDRSGRPEAKLAFEQANSFSAKANQQRAKLQSILGTNKSDEAVFDTISKLAGTNSRADINKLFLARKAVDADTWDEVASGVISQMGRDADGNFSPDRFLTARGKLSDTGKAMLFNTTGKKGLAKQLDDIETVSRRMSQVNKNYGNPSGTARNIGWATIGAAITNGVFNPASIPPVVAGAMSGNLLARYLSKPETAGTVLDYLKAEELAQSRPSATSNALLNKSATTFGRMIAGDLGKPEAADSIIRNLISKNQTPGAQQDNKSIPDTKSQDQPYTENPDFWKAYDAGQAL